MKVRSPSDTTKPQPTRTFRRVSASNPPEAQRVPNKSRPERIQLVANVRKGHWKSLANQRDFLRLLALRLGFQSMEDWYKLDVATIHHYGGRALLGRYGDSVAALLQGAREDHKWQPWKFVQTPAHWWKEPKNQADFLSTLRTSQGWTQSLDQLYGLTTEIIASSGGTGLLNQYHWSPWTILAAIFPAHPWRPWLFKTPPKSWWHSPVARKQYLEWIYIKSNAVSTEGVALLATESSTPFDLGRWYRNSAVSNQVILANQGAPMLQAHEGSLFKLLEATYPDHTWEPTKFTHPHLVGAPIKSPDEIIAESLDSSNETTDWGALSYEWWASGPNQLRAFARLRSALFPAAPKVQGYSMTESEQEMWYQVTNERLQELEAIAGPLLRRFHGSLAEFLLHHFTSGRSPWKFECFEAMEMLSLTQLAQNSSSESKQARGRVPSPVSSQWWLQVSNQRLFIENSLLRINASDIETSFYNGTVTPELLEACGGLPLAVLYDTAFDMAVTVFPELNWKVWRFKSGVPQHWSETPKWRELVYRRLTELALEFRAGGVDRSAPLFFPDLADLSFLACKSFLGSELARASQWETTDDILTTLAEEHKIAQGKYEEFIKRMEARKEKVVLDYLAQLQLNDVEPKLRAASLAQQANLQQEVTKLLP